jgi:hypothetical protein
LAPGKQENICPYVVMMSFAVHRSPFAVRRSRFKVQGSAAQGFAAQTSVVSEPPSWLGFEKAAQASFER